MNDREILWCDALVIVRVEAAAWTGQDDVILNRRIGGNLDASSEVVCGFGALHHTTVEGDVLGGSIIGFVSAIGNSVTICGSLDNGSEYTFTIDVVDEAGNRGTATINATPENSAAPPDVIDLLAFAGDSSA